MRSEGCGSVCQSAGLSVCVSPLLNIPLHRSTSKTTYSASGIGQKVCGVFSETAGFESYGVMQKRTSSVSTCSVYLEGIRSHNDGRVSTPACYLLLVAARVRLSARETTNSAAHPRTRSSPRVCTSVLFAAFFTRIYLHVSLPTKVG